MSLEMSTLCLYYNLWQHMNVITQGLFLFWLPVNVEIIVIPNWIQKDERAELMLVLFL